MIGWELKVSLECKRLALIAFVASHLLYNYHTLLVLSETRSIISVTYIYNKINYEMDNIYQLI